MFKKLFSGLQRLIDTLLHSFWSLVNAISLLFFSLLIFSILAIDLFGDLK